MKIKTQFSLFLVGIIIIPILVVIILSLVTLSNKANNIVIPGYEEIVEELASENLNEENWQKIQYRLFHKPKVIEYTIFDSDFFVIISDIQEFENQKTYQKETILNLITNKESGYLYQLESIDELFLLTRISHENLRHPNKFRSPYVITSIVLIVLFAFCVIMILVITRSITNSVTVLEEYTRRIASGELETQAESANYSANEIVSLTSSLNKMRIELQENEKRRMRFIMGISHDLRTPIALIKGYAEALNDGMIDDKEQKLNSLKIIIDKSDLLNERIDELIDFAKLTTNEWRQNLTEHNLTEFLTDFCKRFKIDCDLIKRNFSSEIKLNPNTKTVFDEKLFTRVLENILGNACRYTKEGGNIKLSAIEKVASDKEAKASAGKEAKSIIQICISDDGIGIKQKDLPYIFDPLWRGTNSRQEDGKGLGLSVVRSIIQSHGWQISATSEGENKGSQFTIEIG